MEYSLTQNVSIRNLRTVTGISWLLALSALVKSGTPVSTAMRALRRDATAYLKERIDKTLVFINNGDNLGEALSKTGLEFPDVEIINEDIPGWLVANDGNLTVALEVELNDELRNEGMARELINRIQNLRKECGLEITDRVNVTISPSENINAAINAFADYIKGQVLADNIVIADNDGCEIDLDDITARIKVEKV